MPKPPVRSLIFISDLQKGDCLRILTLNGKTDEIEILDPETGDIYLKREDVHKQRGSLLGSVPNNNPKKIMADVIIVGFRLAYIDLIGQDTKAFTAMQKVWLNEEEILSV